MSNEFKAGDTVYDSAGREYELAVVVEGVGYVVLPIVADESDEGWHYGDGRVLCEVYPDESHVEARLSKGIAQLHEWYTEASRELADLNKRLADFKRLNEETIALHGKLSAKWEAFRRVDDVMEGRVTHVMFVDGYRASAMPFSEAVMVDPASRNRERRMLTLRWSPKGAEWSMNSYDDGSGCDSPARFFTSVDELKTAIAELANEDTLLGGVAGLCKEYGVELPERHRKAIADKARAEAEAHVARARASLESAEARLREVSDASD